MVLSLIGMIFAGLGYLTPVAGAITQEVIDVLAVLNALRAAIPPKIFRIFERYQLLLCCKIIEPYS